MSKNWIMAFMAAMFIMTLALHTAEASVGESPILRISMVSQTPDPVSPGGYVELRFRVDNLGGRSEDYVYQIITDYPFSLDSESQRNLTVGSLEGYTASGSGALLYWKLRVDGDAVEGTQNRVRIAYFPRDNPSARTITENFPVRIRSAPGLIGISSLNIDPIETSPGNRLSLSMNIDNMASSAIENVRVRLDVAGTPFTPIGSTNQKIVNRIPGNSDRSVEFDFFVNPQAELMVHAIPVIIEYTDSIGEQNTITYTIGVPVNAVPSYIVNLEDSAVFMAGQQGRVVISISNTGKSPMNFAVLELLESDDYEIIGQSRTYLGNLRSDDFETGQFRVFSSSSVSDNMELKVRLTYRDDFGRTYEEYATVNNRVYSMSRARELGLAHNPGYGGTIFFLLIVLGIGFFFYRRSKKKKSRR
ncbi:MAG: COG1361 S-layer family protein [Candidatus Woesearchaeota archaeon]